VSLRLLLLAAASLGLAGLGSMPAGAAPVMRLPGAGPVVASDDVLQRDGFDQRIRLGGGDGANMVKLGLRNRTADLVLAFPTDLSRPNQAGIAAEIAARFPGQAMRVLTSPRRNAYGPVGMAVGADCLYAWQWIDLTPAMMGSAPVRDGLFGPLSRPDPVGAVSLRIRLCRTETASLGDLIASVERMTLDLAAPVRATSGRVLREPPRARTAARRARPAPRPAPRPERTVAAKPSPPPAPAQSSDGRFLAPSTAPPPQRAAPASQQAAPAPAAGGGRYITDAIAPPEPPARAAVAPAPGPALRPASPDSLPRDLPPQAYQPPAQRGAP